MAALNWSKVTVKMIFIKEYEKCIIVSTKILRGTTIFNMGDNKKSWAQNQLIEIIWEGSCDIEGWHHRNKLHLNYIKIDF